MAELPGQPTPMVQLELALSKIVHWASRPDVRREVISRAGVSLTPTDAWVLGRIMEHGPLRLSDLASALGVEKASMTPRVQQLEGAGLVQRSPDPTDGRAILLEISTEGRRVFAGLHAARQELLEDVLTGWSEQQCAAVASSLTALAKRLIADQRTAGPRAAALPRVEAARNRAAGAGRGLAGRGWSGQPTVDADQPVSSTWNTSAR